LLWMTVSLQVVYDTAAYIGQTKPVTRYIYQYRAALAVTDASVPIATKSGITTILRGTESASNETRSGGWSQTSGRWVCFFE
jgi:hypothetical protein